MSDSRNQWWLGQAVRFAPLPSAYLRKAHWWTNPPISPAFDGLKRFRLSPGLLFDHQPGFGRSVQGHTKPIAQVLRPASQAAGISVVPLVLEDAGRLLIAS